MTFRILFGVFLALTFTLGFLLLICKLLPGLPIDQVHADGARNMNALRCLLCHRVKVHGTDHGYGRCASSPVPPPPPARLIEATYRKAGR